ncbi:hypothetical protein Pla175_49220 [Pirellulimonas nuda]|uniref:Uncharacterized protein n=1 Tax=Pirellulimonas nuda TaxID=2528009 RepID=A0A518DJ52_9BACT|nr:hypothetical protein [Pirellulimonas nuda]QDU91493.1 hypothetical protein Pla175_49220 [Pirellulimonas nuda]
MRPDPQQANALEQVRRLVNRTLCDRENLEPDCFGLGQQPLTQQGRLCGYYFWLEGPRNVRLSAVWEIEADAVLCYGADGARFAKLPVDSHDPGRAKPAAERRRAA